MIEGSLPECVWVVSWIDEDTGTEHVEMYDSDPKAIWTEEAVGVYVHPAEADRLRAENQRLRDMLNELDAMTCLATKPPSPEDAERAMALARERGWFVDGRWVWDAPDETARSSGSEVQHG